jgi:hypothetical protein
MHANELPYEKSDNIDFNFNVKSDSNIDLNFNVIIDKNVVGKMIDLGIFKVIKYNKNDEPEITYLTPKFLKQIISYRGKWIDQNTAEISRLCDNNPMITDLSLSWMMLSNYLGLTLQEANNRIEELLPVAYGVIQVFDGLSFQINNR